MKTLKVFYIAAFCVMGLTGCISGVKMTKVTDTNPNPEGLRVFLPQKFLVGRTSATPNSTNLTYDIEMLPDPKQEYAISSYSILAKQNVAIHRSIEGYLKELDLNEDTTTAAAATMAAAGQIAAANFAAITTASTTPQGTNAPSGTTPGGANPGGGYHGGANPGGANPGGANPGGANPGGANPGGANPGGANPGGANPGGASPGGANPGGANPGGANPGGANPGGANPGGANPGGANPNQGNVRVMYRIIDVPSTNTLTDPGSIQLEPVNFKIFNYYYQTNLVPAEDMERSSLYPQK